MTQRDPLYKHREIWGDDFLLALTESCAAGKVSDRGTCSVTDQVCQMTAALYAGMRAHLSLSN